MFQLFTLPIVVVNAGSEQFIDSVAESGTVEVVTLGDAMNNPNIAGDSMTWSGPFLEGTASGAAPAVTFPVGEHVVELEITDQAARTVTNTTTQLL